MCIAMDCTFEDPERFWHLSPVLPQNRITPVPVSDGGVEQDEGYSSSSSSSCDVGAIDKAMDEYYNRLIAKENRFLLETVYQLDHATTITIGISAVRDFTPVIKLTNEVLLIPEDGVSVVYSMEDWSLVLDYIREAAEFLLQCEENNEGEKLSSSSSTESRRIFNTTLSRKEFLEFNCIKIDVDDSRSVYLRRTPALALLPLKRVIDSHLNRLKQLDLQSTYFRLIHLIGDDEQILQKFVDLTSLLDPSSAAAMLELVHFQELKVYADHKSIKAALEQRAEEKDDPAL